MASFGKRAPVPLVAMAKQSFRQRVLEARDRIQDRVPDIDPADLLVILQSLLRSNPVPRHFLLRKLGPRRHGF